MGQTISTPLIAASGPEAQGLTPPLLSGAIKGQLPPMEGFKKASDCVSLTSTDRSVLGWGLDKSMPLAIIEPLLWVGGPGEGFAESASCEDISQMGH